MRVLCNQGFRGETPGVKWVQAWEAGVGPRQKGHPLGRLPTPKPKKKRLGDHVEAALTRVGVTQDRITRLLGTCGGCTRRKKFLNDLDEWAEQWADKAIAAARAALDRILKR